MAHTTAQHRARQYDIFRGLDASIAGVTTWRAAVVFVGLVLASLLVFVLLAASGAGAREVVESSNLLIRVDFVTPPQLP